MNIINLLTSLNWISVVLAFIAYFFLGALWYMLLFPKLYRISLGRDPQEKASEALIFIIGPAVCALIIIISSAILLYALKISSIAELAQYVLVIGVGFLVTNTVNIAINPNIPRPFLYGFITGMYHLMGMVIINSILYFAM
jgi:hypothetical protein